MTNPYEFDDPDRALIRKLRRAIWAVNKGDPAKDYLDEDDFVDAARLLLQVIGPDVEGLITNANTDFDTWFGIVRSGVMERVGIDYQNKDATREEYEEGYPASFLIDDIAEEEESTRRLDNAKADWGSTK